MALMLMSVSDEHFIEKDETTKELYTEEGNQISSKDNFMKANIQYAPSK